MRKAGWRALRRVRPILVRMAAEIGEFFGFAYMQNVAQLQKSAGPEPRCGLPGFERSRLP